jgi:hypothetical protein
VKRETVAYFKILFQRFAGGTERIHTRKEALVIGGLWPKN